MPKQAIQNLSKTSWQIFFVVLGLLFLYLVREVVAIFLFALIIASTVDLMVKNLKQLKIPRFLGVIIIYLLFILVLAVISYFIVPLFVSQFKVLAVQFPDLISKIQDEAGFLRKFGLLENLGQFLNVLASGLWAGGGTIVDISTRLFGGLVALVSIFVISFYLSLQEKGIGNFLRFIFPKEYENYVINLWTRSQQKMGRWLQGQIFLALIIGVASFIGLTLLGVQYALILAVIAAIFEIIPIVGPVISAVPAILIAVLQDPFLGLLTLILYVFIQQMESHLVVPNVLKRATGLNPVIVILALLAGAKLGGILGMLLAVPLTAVLVELIVDITKRKPQEMMITKLE